MDIANNIEKIREEFPILSRLAYMNSAAHGPTLRRVHDATELWWAHRMNEEQVENPDALGEAAKMLSCRREELCYVNRVTQGLNMVADMMPLERGDNIVVTDLGYPSNVFVWFPYREKGVEIRRIRHEDGLIGTEDFERAVDDRTRVVSISRVEWTSGLRYDMKALSGVAHEHGAYLVDDSYQAMGPIEIDLHDSGVDFFTAGSEKWMCSPAMTGVFYIREGIWDYFEPSYRYYGNVEEAFASGAPCEKPDHDNYASYLKPLYRDARKHYRGCVSEEFHGGYHAALEYFNEIGSANIEKRTAELSQYLIDGLKEQPVKVNTPEEPCDRGALVTYNTGSFEKNQEIFDALKKEGIVVAHRYAAGVGGLRVSCHFFNTYEEIDRLLALQKKLL
ncbi:aminotransferase class V-fold PLP-dependent enzyme [Candidatus Bathyarchaeota archaeon]|nr:MAG: aminotransferase class V-fold PLP-dependent enzyme [Candidatus Bathyarchaeota archaeon]